MTSKPPKPTPPVLLAPGGRNPLSPAAVEAHRRAEAEARAASIAAPAKPARRPARASDRRRETAKDGSHVVLVLPDMHHPFADPAAMAAVLAIAKAVKPTRIVSLGDSVECAAFSAHPARSVAEQAIHDFAHELETCGAWIDRICEAAGPQLESWQYLYGNHEQHVERECIRLGAIGLAVRSMIEPSIVLGRGRPLLRFTPYIADYAKDRRPASHLRGGASMAHHKITNDLIAVHGWTIARNAAQVHLDKVKTCSLIHGHTHRQQSATGRLWDSDKILKAWSPGCLSLLQPAWHHSSPTEWVHGLDVIYCKDDCLAKGNRDPAWTNFTVTIVNGETVLPHGTKVAA